MAGFGIPGISDNGGGSTSGKVGTTEYKQLLPEYKQVSPTSDPTFAKLLEHILNVTPTALPGIEQLTAQGMNSPLLQLVLGPAMQRLQAPQAQARQNLTEQTRATGGLRGSTYGQDMNKLVANQGLQQNDLMAQVIQQVLGTLISGQLQSQQNSMLPGKSLTDVLRTIAPQTITSQTVSGQKGSSSSGWENIPPSRGLATPMSSGGSASPEDRDAQLRGFPSAEAMRFQQMLGSLGGGTSRSSGGISSGSTSTPYTPYLDPLSGGGSNITFNPVSGRYESVSPSNTGTFTPEQGGPTSPAPMPEWNPVTGAYQGGSLGGTIEPEKPWWVE